MDCGLVAAQEGTAEDVLRTRGGFGLPAMPLFFFIVAIYFLERYLSPF
jgi:hypothetical protein